MWFVQESRVIRLRFLLFYGLIEALNTFTNDIKSQLERMGHEAYIMDLRESVIFVEKYFEKKIHCAIYYDGIGMFLKETFDMWDIVVINILVDHPMTFSHVMREPPRKFIQFSPDCNHVEFAEKYYGLKNVFFLPHMASGAITLERVEKEIPLLFGGWYRPINEAYTEIKESADTDEVEKWLLLHSMEYMLEDSSMPLETALEKCILEFGVDFPYSDRAILLRKAKPVDEFIRMYYRGKVISEIIKAGIPITLIGEGWDKFPLAASKWVNRLAKVEYEEIFSYMKRAEITLNVMPWFKAGSHERVLDSLKCYSCPLIDESSWLLENLKPDEECAYYSLSRLEEIPDKIYDLLAHPEQREKIVENGRRKVLSHFTSKQITEQILGRLKECYG